MKYFLLCAELQISTVTRIPVAKEPNLAWKIRLIEEIFDALFEILRFSCRYPSEFYGNLQQKILNLLINFDKSSDLIPYSRCPKLRVQAYKILRVLALHGNPHCATALNGIVGLLNAGLRDSAPEVVQECREGLSVCRAVIFPKFPPIETPILETLKNVQTSEISWDESKIPSEESQIAKSSNSIDEIPFAEKNRRIESVENFSDKPSAAEIGATSKISNSQPVTIQKGTF